MALTGTLEDLSITNIVQINCTEKSTAQIIINWKGHDAAMFFLEGDIIHAKFKDLKGEKALYKILRLEEGDFTITTKPETIPERNIYDSWKGLLFEGMRVMDESEKEKTTIVRSIALDLTQHPDIKKLLVITKSGECIQNDGFDSPERYGILATAFLKKARQLSGPLAIGDVVCASYSTDEDNVFFFECDHFFIVAQIHRGTQIEPLFRLVEDLKSRLKVAEAEPE